jgi:hypothetical protein
MAETSNTLAGLVQMNDQNLADMEVTDLLQDAPVMQIIFAKAASQGGTLHKYLKQVVAAGAQFRGVNTGVLNTAPQEELVTDTCKFLDGHFHRDVAIASGYKGGAAEYMAKETVKELRALFASLEKQTFQSTGNDASGFVGLPGFATLDTLDDSDHVIDAGGSGGRSAYIIRTGDDDLAMVAGNDGNLDFDYDPDQTPQKIVTNASTGAGYMAHVVNLAGYFCLQEGSIYSVVRIANLDSTTGHKMTDALLSQALSKYPSGRGATHIILDRVLSQELQASRTATNPTGAPAPFPSEAFGVPIVNTDHLDTSEDAVATTTAAATTTA